MSKPVEYDLNHKNFTSLGKLADELTKVYELPVDAVMDAITSASASQGEWILIQIPGATNRRKYFVQGKRTDKWVLRIRTLAGKEK